MELHQGPGQPHTGLCAPPRPPPGPACRPTRPPRRKRTAGRLDEGHHGRRRRPRSRRSWQRGSCTAIRPAAAASHPVPRLSRAHALEQLGHQGPAAGRWVPGCAGGRRQAAGGRRAGTARQHPPGCHPLHPHLIAQVPTPLASTTTRRTASSGVQGRAGSGGRGCCCESFACPFPCG